MQHQSEKKTVIFRPTSQQQKDFHIPYQAAKTIEQYKQQLAEHYSVAPHLIKTIFKGKILSNNQTAQQAGLGNGLAVMLVFSKEKEQKPKVDTKDQIIPNAGLNTGLGGSSPVGFGNYGIVNHPQYMSAIAGAVNQEKMQQMMDDPYYQEMMQQMMQDPDTMQYLMNQNPMMKKMVEDNPMMKTIFSNKEMLKAVFNPQTMKMAKEMMKNGGTSNLNSNPFMGGLNNNQQSSTSSSSQNSNFNPLMNPMMNMFNPQQNSSQQQQKQQQNPNMGMGMNPMWGINPMWNMNPWGMSPNGMGMNPMMGMNQMGMNQMGMNPMMGNFMNQSQQISDAQKYKNQLKELQLMGFKDKQKCLKVLKQVSGNVDAAIEKLCEMDL